MATVVTIDVSNIVTKLLPISKEDISLSLFSIRRSTTWARFLPSSFICLVVSFEMDVSAVSLIEHKIPNNNKTKAKINCPVLPESKITTP
jgi:hypothetical protein